MLGFLVKMYVLETTFYPSIREFVQLHLKQPRESLKCPLFLCACMRHYFGWAVGHFKKATNCKPKTLNPICNLQRLRPNWTGLLRGRMTPSDPSASSSYDSRLRLPCLTVRDNAKELLMHGSHTFMINLYDNYVQVFSVTVIMHCSDTSISMIFFQL